MLKSELFDLTLKTYENKLQHSKSSLKIIFSKPENIKTKKGLVDLKNIDGLISSCIDYETKINFLVQHKHILIGEEHLKNTIIKRENNVKKENSNVKKENRISDDIEIIERPCCCNNHSSNK